MTNGTILKDPSQYTFSQKEIKNNQVFGYIDDHGFLFKKWMRFDVLDYSEAMSLSLTAWDGPVFKPIQDIYLHGFGIFSSWDGNDLDLKI